MQGGPRSARACPVSSACPRVSARLFSCQLNSAAGYLLSALRLSEGHSIQGPRGDRARLGNGAIGDRGACALPVQASRPDAPASATVSAGAASPTAAVPGAPPAGSSGSWRSNLTVRSTAAVRRLPCSQLGPPPVPCAGSTTACCPSRSPAYRAGPSSPLAHARGTGHGLVSGIPAPRDTSQ